MEATTQPTASRVFIGYHWTATKGVRCDCYLLRDGWQVELVYVQDVVGGEKELFRATHSKDQISGLVREMVKATGVKF